LQSGIDNIARQLNSRAGLTELEESLRESGNGHQAMVQNLQRSLEPQEIEELNELLKWVMFGEEPFDVNQLQAAMVRLGLSIISSIAHQFHNQSG